MNKAMEDLDKALEIGPNLHLGYMEKVIFIIKK
ncbi:hypothetical protein X474_26215 [Dethiosulfatarculus sandiegensis]|uniref:Uncharacterized protein n=1 Tax=Dethiosulfatarculus sandiegensis TaxID=1429043 RepID=A0A0D2JP62_9BACT|nr:hypothetical protein X474_26215 [Dethiosulfatarculus sandiegensis]